MSGNKCFLLLKLSPAKYLQSTVVQLLMMLQILCCLLSDRTRQNTHTKESDGINPVCVYRCGISKKYDLGWMVN